MLQRYVSDACVIILPTKNVCIKLPCNSILQLRSLLLQPIFNSSIHISTLHSFRHLLSHSCLNALAGRLQLLRCQSHLIRRWESFGSRWAGNKVQQHVFSRRFVVVAILLYHHKRGEVSSICNGTSSCMMQRQLVLLQHTAVLQVGAEQYCLLICCVREG